MSAPDSKMKWRTTLVIESEADPRDWSLQNFYWARENDEAVITKKLTVRIRSKKKGSK